MVPLPGFGAEAAAPGDLATALLRGGAARSRIGSNVLPGADPSPVLYSPDGEILSSPWREATPSLAQVRAASVSEPDGDAKIATPQGVARVLLRFLGNAARDRALDQLSETVAALLAAGGAARVRIAGPESLVNRLRQQAETLKVVVEVTVNPDAADVTVTLDDTIVETRIAEWMERVTRAASGGPHG
jgi:hypothetical protein